MLGIMGHYSGDVTQGKIIYMMSFGEKNSRVVLGSNSIKSVRMDSHVEE